MERVSTSYGSITPPRSPDQVEEEELQCKPIIWHFSPGFTCCVLSSTFISTAFISAGSLGLIGLAEFPVTYSTFILVISTLFTYVVAVSGFCVDQNEATQDNDQHVDE